MDEKPTRPLTLAQRRFLEAVERIRMDRPTLDDFAYMARELVQVTLPHRNPGDVPAWSRTNGNLTMTIRPGWNRRTAKSVGYPYGTIPRLLLFWLTAEAVAAKNRGDHSGRIELGSSLSDFMFQLGLDPSRGGPRSDARRLHDQMERLFNASISFESERIEGGRHGDERINMAVAAHVMLWWSPRDPSQAALWNSFIHLSREFFTAITAYPVPLDMRALKALKNSPLALDLYSWLTYEAYRAHKSGKGRFIAWDLLAQQMGGDYARTTDFQQKGVKTLRKIQALYPTLKLGSLRGGIRIEPKSLPAITPRETISVEQAEPAAIEPTPEPVTPPTALAKLPLDATKLADRLKTIAHILRTAETPPPPTTEERWAIKGLEYFGMGDMLEGANPEKLDQMQQFVSRAHEAFGNYLEYEYTNKKPNESNSDVLRRAVDRVLRTLLREALKDQ